MSRLLKGRANNSFPALASFFAKENDLSIKEMDELLEEVKRPWKNNPKIEMTLCRNELMNY